MIKKCNSTVNFQKKSILRSIVKTNNCVYIEKDNNCICNIQYFCNHLLFKLSSTLFRKILCLGKSNKWTKQNYIRVNWLWKRKYTLRLNSIVIKFPSFILQMLNKTISGQMDKLVEQNKTIIKLQSNKVNQLKKKDDLKNIISR